MQREKEEAFKSHLTHAYRGLTWLRHMQVTGLTHAHKGLAESYIDQAGALTSPEVIRHFCLGACLHMHDP